MKKKDKNIYTEGIRKGAKSIISIETSNAYKAKLTKKPTNAEKCIDTLLQELNKRKYIDYKKQEIFYKPHGGYIIVDFYLPKIKLVIEVDGEYHDTEEQRYKDSNRDSWLKMQKIKILRIKNKEAYGMTYSHLLNRIFPKKIKKLTPDTVLTFGKYKGKTVQQVFKEDSGYLKWMEKEKIAVFDYLKLK